MCGAPQLFMHPYVCPSSLPMVKAAASFMQGLCREVCVDATLRHPPAIRSEHCWAVITLPEKYPFFCFPGTASPESDGDFFRVYGRSLGMTRMLLQELLLPERLSDDEAAVKSLRKSAPISLERLSVAALREAKAIHNSWWLRARERAGRGGSLSGSTSSASRRPSPEGGVPRSKRTRRRGVDLREPGAPPGLVPRDSSPGGECRRRRAGAGSGRGPPS